MGCEAVQCCCIISLDPGHLSHRIRATDDHMKSYMMLPRYATRQHAPMLHVLAGITEMAVRLGFFKSSLARCLSCQRRFRHCRLFTDGELLVTMLRISTSSPHVVNRPGCMCHACLPGLLESLAWILGRLADRVASAMRRTDRGV